MDPQSTILSLRDVEPDAPNPSLVRTFVVVQLLGGVGISIILLTALISHRVRRHSTWISFCVSWIIYVLSYTLLTFAGRQLGPQPERGLCIIQSGMIYAAPVLTAGTTLALVIQLFVNLAGLISPSNAKVALWRTTVLLVFPYVLWVIILVESFFVVVKDQNHVERSSIYCILKSGLLGNISAAIVIALMITVLAFEGYIGFALYRNWRIIRERGEAGTQALHMMLRAAVFSVFGILSIVISSIFISDISGPLPNMFIALTPLEALLVFGTQRDLLRSWKFWGRKDDNPFTHKKGKSINSNLTV